MPERDARTGVTFQQLYTEHVVLVCRPSHPILLGPVSEQSIKNYTLILPPQGTVISQTVERYLASIGLPEFRAAYETVALPVGRKLVCLSDALWFISRGVVGDELIAGTLLLDYHHLCCRTLLASAWHRVPQSMLNAESLLSV